jgi:hypothetical protein
MPRAAGVLDRVREAARTVLAQPALGRKALEALQRILDKYRRERLRSVPFFDGLMAGEIDALLESCAGVPDAHHPVRGRIITGESAFRRFVTDSGGRWHRAAAD